MNAARKPEHARLEEIRVMQIDFERNVKVREFDEAQALQYCAKYNVRPFWPRAVAKRPVLQRHEVLNLELVK